MRKFLKLVAIFAFAASGQAFAVPIPVPIPLDATPSDELQIFNNIGTKVSDFFFVDTIDLGEMQVSVNGKNIIPIEHPLYKQGVTDNFEFLTHAVVLKEPSGRSDVLYLTLDDTTITGEHKLKLNFYDDSDVPQTVKDFIEDSKNSSLVTKLEETGDLVNYTKALGLDAGPITPFAVLFVSDIPEPEIYLMMGIGLALMGFVARRRQGHAAAA